MRINRILRFIRTTWLLLPLSVAAVLSCFLAMQTVQGYTLVIQPDEQESSPEHHESAMKITLIVEGMKKSRSGAT